MTKKTNDKIVLELTPEQAKIVERATELFFRLHMGQFEEIKWALYHSMSEWPRNSVSSIDSTLGFLRSLFFPNLRLGESNGVDTNPDCHTAFNVYQAVRYVYSWYMNPEGGIGVNYDTPMGGGMPVPKCYVVKEGEKHEINGRDQKAPAYPYHR